MAIPHSVGTAVRIRGVKALCDVLRRHIVTGEEQLSILRQHWPRSVHGRHCRMLKGLTLIHCKGLSQEMVFVHFKKKRDKHSLDSLQLSRS